MHRARDPLRSTRSRTSAPLALGHQATANLVPLVPKDNTEGRESRAQPYPGRSPILRSASQRTAVRGDEIQEFRTQS